MYSNRTYELDARTTVSALKDVMNGQLDAASLRRRMEALRHANEQEVNPQKAKETFRRLLQKGESEAAQQAFDSTRYLRLAGRKYELAGVECNLLDRGADQGHGT